jgi:outer membrane receptor protein involved in Fe transport
MMSSVALSRRLPFYHLRSLVIATVGAVWMLSSAAQAAELPVDDAPDNGSAVQSSTALEGSGAALKPVLVRGVRLRDRISQNSLSNEDMKQLPGTGGDPLRAAQSLPGVASTSDTNAAPAVRGAAPSDNAYYVDFLPVGYLFHAGGLTSVFNGDLIRRFDMYSAAWSPEFDDVLGAVFDISLRRPREDKIGGKIDVSLLTSGVLVEGPLSEDVSFFLAGRRSYFDLLASTIQDKKSGATFTVPVYSDTQGRVLWNLGQNNRVRLDFSTANDRLGFSLTPDATRAKQEPLMVGDTTLTQSFNSVAAVWDTDLGPSSGNTLALGRMNTYVGQQVGQVGQLQATLTDVYLREQSQFRLGASHELIGGLDLSKRSVDYGVNIHDPRCTEFDPNCSYSNAPQIQASQSLQQDVQDVYVMDRWHFTPQWTLTTGLRWTRDDYLNYNALQPRLGLEWAWTPHTSFTLGWGRHSESPPLTQTAAGIGNPALVPLESRQVAVSMAQELAGGWSWRAEAYRKEFSGLVLSDPQFNYINGGSATAQGVELLVKKNTGTRLSGFLSLTLAQAKRRNEVTGEEFPFSYDEPVIITSAAQYRLSERWQFGAKWSLHSGAPITPIVGSGIYPDGRPRPLYGAINSERLPPYHRLDLRADWHYSKHLTAYFEVINAYAQQNVAGYSYNADYSKREAVYQLPLMPSLGMQYSF